MGALKSTPIGPLLLELGEPPVVTRMDTLNRKMGCKILNDQEHPLHSRYVGSHPQRERIYSRQKPLYVNFIDWKNAKAPNIVLTGRNFNLPNPWTLRAIEKLELWTKETPNPETTDGETSNILFRAAVEKHAPGYTLIYTDGSYRKETNRAGLGIYIPSISLQISGGLPTDTTNNEAEIAAISVALQEIDDMPRGKYLLCTDSKQAIDQISNYHQNLDKLKMMIQEILYMGDRLQNMGWTIMISWIPGHIGITGNVVADMLAGREDRNNNYKWDGTSQELTRKIEDSQMEEWQSIWDETATTVGTKYYGLFPTVSKKGTRREIQDRKLAVIYTRLRTGHSLTRAYLHKIGQIK